VFFSIPFTLPLCTMSRLATTADGAAVDNLDNHYVTTTPISFAERALEVDETAQRIEEVGARLPWHVFERDGVVVGYQSQVRKRRLPAGSWSSWPNPELNGARPPRHLSPAMAEITA
jgi:hypothetical protein